MSSEVWKAEFCQYDVEQHDSITAEEFAALIAGQVLGAHLPYLVGNIRCLRGRGDVVTLYIWLGMNEVLYAEQLAANAEMFSSCGMSVTKRGFRRLLCMAGVPALPQATIDIFFIKNGDGSMEIDEFLSVMRKKVQNHYSVPPRTRKSLSRRFLAFSSEALADVVR